ncbi:MAG: heavy metal translocating P-type ATPase [Promethearchaeota archaeon]
MPDQRYENGNNCTVCEVAFEPAIHRSSFWRDYRVLIILVSTALFALGLIVDFVLHQQLIAFALYLFAVGIAGYSIAKEGIKALIFKRRLNIAFLMTIAAVASFFIGHPAEGAAVMVLYFIAEFLEIKANENAQRSVASLMKLAPETATIKRDGKESRVHVHEVNLDEIVVVRPGEKIPLDGIVIQGSSSVNQAPITGESLPVEKEANDEVYAGTINNEGYLEIRVTRLSNETVLAKILTMVEEAQKSKSPIEHFVDKFAKYYTPSVVVVAVVVATIPSILLGALWIDWIYRALILLVISCPCALAIGTPVAMVSALTSATKQGVLIKGSRYIEALGNVKVVAFDKTGTLTSGQLAVTDVISFDESDESVLRVAASIESFSEHPISKAIVAKALNPGLQVSDVDDFTTITGQGVSGRIDTVQYFVGSERLFTKLAIPYPKNQVRHLEEEGKTVILVGDSARAIGVIAIQDTIRPSSMSTIATLKQMGIKTVMVTGDNEHTAAFIAKQIGIDAFYANLMPEDKVKILEELQQHYGAIAMVGDGVNDAPSLATADVGIAMGAIGSDAAIETADIALMHDDLAKLPYLFELSQKTRSIVRQNIGTALIVKFSLAALVFPGLITLWLAVAIGDMGLSLAVILNAMRLSRVRAE